MVKSLRVKTLNLSPNLCNFFSFSPSIHRLEEQPEGDYDISVEMMVMRDRTE